MKKKLNYKFSNRALFQLILTQIRQCVIYGTKYLNNLNSYELLGDKRRIYITHYRKTLEKKFSCQIDFF